jgi:hypothetical protein
MYFLSILISVLHMILFYRIMDDGRPHMWTCFIMENEMKNIIAPPLLEGSLSSMVVAPPLLQLPIVKWCHKKKKTVDDETNVGGRWSDIALVNIIDLYEEEWRHLQILFVIQTLDTHSHQTPSSIAK